MKQYCDRDFRLNEPGRIVYAPVGPCALGTFQARTSYGTWGAAVLTAVVSNDPKGNVFEDHPDAITLTAQGISAAFRVAGYRFYGVRVSTGNATEAIAEVSVRPAE